ncbi:MAG: type II secretion system protein GspG [Planctomycetes bacterium]|nr:type II secretion system protein GspG [Planctomycetota bacterium]
MKTNRKRNGRRTGLTLLELMIVLIILVGIIALVGPRLLGSQKKADIKTAQAQIGNLTSALKMYAVDMKTYPSTDEGLELLMRAPEDERLASIWDGPYLEGKSLPLDPWGSEFQYEYSAEDGADFPRINSPGPDKQVGTSDDIANRSADDTADAANTSGNPSRRGSNKS